jgi:tRNA G46 methylase TrmB
MNNTMFLSLAISKLKPGSEFVFHNDDYSTIQWISLDGNPPTSEEVQEEFNNQKEYYETRGQRRREARLAIAERLGLTEQEIQTLIGGSN